MVIALIIILIGVGLGYGFNKANYVNFGVIFLRPKYPYYHFGVSFEGVILEDEEGSIYHKDTLKIGFVLFVINIDFYTNIGKKDSNPVIAKKNDLAIGQPTPLI